MSIKSTNINPNILPSPPIGYSYIGTDLISSLFIKLDNGTVIYPTGVNNLSDLLDVNISGQTLGEALVWDGSKWINADVIPDLSNYYTKTQVDSGLTSLSTAISSFPIYNDTSISTALVSEISIRESNDISLSTAISSIPVYNDSSISSALVSEISIRESNDISLSTAISSIPIYNDTSISTALVTEISIRESNDISLSTAISSISGYDDTSISTALVSEISIRESNDISLSTAISSIPVYNDSSISSALVSEISIRESNEISLSTAISSVSGYDDTSISTALVSEISIRESDIISLSTAISSIPIYNDTSISTALVSEISIRESNDISLSTAISSIDISSISTSILGKVNINSPGGQSHILNENTNINFTTQNGLDVLNLNMTPGNGGTYINTSIDSGVTYGHLFVGSQTHSSNKIINYESDLQSNYTDRTLIDKGFLSSELTGYTSNITSLSSALSVEQSKETEIMNISHHYSGFPERTSTTISFGGTRTFTITGTNFPIYINAVKYLKNTESIQIPNVTGLYWFWYNQSNALTSGLTGQAFSDCLIANVYFNAATNTGILSDERHWFGRDSKWHEMTHESIGCRYVNGLTGTFTNTSITTTIGEIYDEDLEILIPSGTSCNIVYKSGSTDWVFSGTTKPYLNFGTTLYYNNGNALATLAGNDYVAHWVYATNNITQPIIVIIGQTKNSNIGTLRTTATPESLVLGNIPAAEMKLLYRVIYRQVGTTPTYIESADYRSVSSLPNTSYVATSHLLLTDIGTLTHTEVESSLSTAISSTSSLSTAIGSVGGSTAYSGITYNIVVSGSTVVANQTINFNTTDILYANLTGNTAREFDFSNGITGKTMTLVLTNTGVGNTTTATFNATTCKTFGNYAASKTNAISVLCVSATNPKFWVTIINV